MFFALIYLGVVLVTLAGMWKVYAKASQPGWATIVPIYNMVVLLNIVRKPVWWIVLFLVPFVNFIIIIMVYLEIAKVFGKGAGTAVGLLFLPFVFWPMPGFGDAQYVGVAA
jgi:hypothetical protein